MARDNLQIGSIVNIIEDDDVFDFDAIHRPCAVEGRLAHTTTIITALIKLVQQVLLAGDEDDRSVRVRTLPEVLDPLSGISQRLLSRAVVADEGALGTAIVSHCNRPETLLAGRVPRLHEHVVPVDLENFLDEVNTNRRDVVLCVPWAARLRELLDQCGLSNV